eukprot:CAMPEP_0169164534 /NCGR_PEP_ID=MMETSP1015-20121227/58899_1 /TAXON_ID=342587 /ORGANISM="Karlodinium micrum, Strain CCMP2283" /LENGTH=177 /DNA_ID=CAMNT_0009237003 /DNA_START=431 /DNA_END=964 /DNA_ORIENTATION=+
MASALKILSGTLPPLPSASTPQVPIRDSSISTKVLLSATPAAKVASQPASSMLGICCDETGAAAFARPVSSLLSSNAGPATGAECSWLPANMNDDMSSTSFNEAILHVAVLRPISNFVDLKEDEGGSKVKTATNVNVNKVWLVMLQKGMQDEPDGGRLVQPPQVLAEQIRYCCSREC